MKRLCAVIFALACFVPAVTQAAPVLQTVPGLVVCANDLCRDLSGSIIREGKTFFFNFTGDNSIVFDGLAEISLSGVYNSDPFITFGTTTTNFVAGPVTYAFLFGTPIVPGFYNVATSTGGVTVTNGASGTATVTTSAIYPTYISAYGTVGLVPTNLGVDLGTLPCTAGPGTPFTVTNVCNQGTTTNVFSPLFFDNLEALLTYTQSDAFSVASWSGAVTLNFDAQLIPEPSLLMLFGVAITTFGVRRRLRR